MRSGHCSALARNVKCFIQCQASAAGRDVLAWRITCGNARAALAALDSGDADHQRHDGGIEASGFSLRAIGRSAATAPARSRPLRSKPSAAAARGRTGAGSAGCRRKAGSARGRRCGSRCPPCFRQCCESKDGGFKKRIAGKPIGTVEACAGDFAACAGDFAASPETFHIAPAREIHCNSAHVVMRRRANRDQLPRRIEARGLADASIAGKRAANAGPMLLRASRKPGARGQLCRADRPGDDISRRQFRARNVGEKTLGPSH